MVALHNKDLGLMVERSTRVSGATVEGPAALAAGPPSSEVVADVGQLSI